MEPKLPPVSQGQPLFDGSRDPAQVVRTAELPPDMLSGEVEPKREAEAIIQNATSSLAATTVAASPSSSSVTIVDAVPASSSSTAPLVAADEDLIEKEWIDKAKSIILATKDDPYRREQEVAKLQVEYLRKRYGKELGSVE